MHQYAFAPETMLQPVAGGVLIGLGATLLFATLGRVAGVSGILAGLLRPKPDDFAWRLAFVLGLFIAGTSWNHFTTISPQAGHGTNLWRIIVAGLAIGFGARLGGGCTSGHGVCGIGRLSPRSLVATVTFVTTGAMAVILQRHIFGGSP